MPEGRAVSMATVVQHRGSGLLFLVRHVEWGQTIRPPPLLKLISSITVSLQRTDWITPVPLSSSLVLIPPPPLPPPPPTYFLLAHRG